MPIDQQKPKGSVKRSTPNSGGANPRLAPVIGIVKDNVDATRAGRIWVYLVDNSGLDPENSDNWRPVYFLSPFYGKTKSSSPNTGEGEFKTNPHSYGMWFAPPDIGTEVLCVFHNGDMNYGFYIGCIPDPEALHMVPAIGASTNVKPGEGEAQKYGGALRLPVTNINSNNKDITNTAKYLTEAKPVHRYVAATMWQQGLIRDPIRGPISSSAQRENISRVGFGISTPGRPIYEGGFNDKNIANNLTEDKADQLKIVARRAGHSIVMDDGDVVGRDQLIRIRTADGHQILMSDDGQTLFIIHKNGQSYVELGKEGTVDIYSTNSINLRTQGDLNLHADNNVNIHAGKKLNMYGESIHIQSEKEFKQKTGADHSVYAMGVFTAKADGAMSLASTGDISVASSAKAFINGSRVNLNSGKSGTVPKAVEAIEKILHTDTLFDKQKGFTAAPGKLSSITTRAPAHTPWANAGLGVNVKTNLSSDSKLPASPSAALKATNTTAASTGITSPVAGSTVAKAPITNSTSNSLNPSVTKAITGQVATQAAQGATADAVKKGAAIIGATNQANTVAVGQFAMTPQQLEKAGVIKPGSSALVNSLIATGANIAAALPSTLFTGKPGAENLGSFVNNIPAQSDALVKNLQVAQTSLQNSGVITGNESASQLGGMVMSAAKNPISDVIGAVQSATPTVDGGLAGIPNLQTGKLNSALQDIAQGNYASQVGENAGGALDGIQSAVESVTKSPATPDTLDTSRGLVAGAYEAIKNTIPTLQPNEPVNLTAQARRTAGQIINASSQTIDNNLSQQAQGLNVNKQIQNRIVQSNNVVGSKINNPTLTTGGATQILPAAASVASSILSAAKGSNTAATNMVESTMNSLNQPLDKAAMVTASPTGSVLGKQTLTDAANTMASGILSSTASGIASGLTYLPGGQEAAGSITNYAMGNIPNMPGTTDLKATINNISTDAVNQINKSGFGNIQGYLNNPNTAASFKNAAINGLTSFATSKLPAGAAAALQNALGSIASQGSGIKTPSIGVNTTDRSGIESGVSEALGDPSIPSPNYGGVDEASVGKIEDIQKRRAEFIAKQKDLSAKYNKTNTEYYLNYGAYLLASSTLPQGSPSLQPLKVKYEKDYTDRNNVKQELDNLYKQYPEFSSKNTTKTISNSTTTVAGQPTTTNRVG